MTANLRRNLSASTPPGVVFAAVLMMQVGCSAPPMRHQPSTTARTPIVRAALRMLGRPYRYGADGPIAFDCSGLTQYSYARAGIEIPRTVRLQYRLATHVRHLRPGDLVFFRIHSHAVSHVGIYIGNGRFVHAPASGGHVTTASLRAPYWHRYFAGGGRYYGTRARLTHD